jgi:hypothetical protein
VTIMVISICPVKSWGRTEGSDHRGQSKPLFTTRTAMSDARAPWERNDL